MRVTCYKHTLGRDDGDETEGNNDSDNDTLPPTTTTTTATFKQRHDHQVRALDEGKRQQQHQLTRAGRNTLIFKMKQ